MKKYKPSDYMDSDLPHHSNDDSSIIKTIHVGNK